jgi:protein tyrosine phosphatase
MSREEHLARLAQHRDKLADVVNGLGQQGWLEKQWKEVVDKAEVGEKRSVSVARCYPDMNRTPDVLPYDQTRVELKGWKDDYINASRIASFPNRSSSVSGAVVTQAPQARYLSQFWGLVWQEGVEVLVCLVPDHDLGGVGVYLPQEKEKKEVGKFTISTFSCKRHPTYVERVVNVMNKDGGSTRALVHLQMIGWQGPDLPASPAPLVDTALAVLEQKSRTTILVHCLEGSSKSGTFLSLLWLVAEMEGKTPPLLSSASIWPPVVQAMAHVVHQRKGIVRDRQYIGLVYQALLHYCNHTLGKAGMPTTPLSNSAAIVLPTMASEQFPVTGQLPGPQRHPSPSPAPSSASVPEMELVEPPKHLVQKDQVQSHQDELASLHVDTHGAVSVPASGSQGASPKIPTDLSKLADISLTESPKKQRITKEDFLRPSTGLVTKEQNPKDPLDMLDPLWSLK